jgi:hypothetical protein
MRDEVNRRHFIQSAAAIGGVAGLGHFLTPESVAAEPEPLKPLGDPKGIHPGRVVWVHDPKVLDWQGPEVGHLIDGLLSGKHPVDHVPRRWKLPPFEGNWTCSLLASQDPVAVDSVGYDSLRAEYDDFPRRSGAEDYLHEAALAHDPPSGTFYDPDHPTPVKQLESLGVHEHWNNPDEKKYSRNLGSGPGIELIACGANGQEIDGTDPKTAG